MPNLNFAEALILSPCFLFLKSNIKSTVELLFISNHPDIYNYFTACAAIRKLTAPLGWVLGHPASAKRFAETSRRAKELCCL
jgi:hypothetical protein